ncbi:MAG TPA: preprotein translocase subunit YajC [Isosphaeraceae bacterium]|jgi:preprotein translocase subunit YajC|nr:preprotein translocase subunit YajC [Isosphaeraceae bacterium]
MLGYLTSFPMLFAQAQGQAAGQESGSSFTSLIIMLLPLMALYYFMIARPQQQQERDRRKMVETLKKNDRVVTLSGIYGTVVLVDPAADKVVLRVDDDRGVKITFSKSSVVRLVEPPSEKDKDKEKPAEAAQRT